MGAMKEYLEDIAYALDVSSDSEEAATVARRLLRMGYKKTTPDQVAIPAAELKQLLANIRVAFGMPDNKAAWAQGRLALSTLTDYLTAVERKPSEETLRKAREIGERQTAYFNKHGKYPDNEVSFVFNGVSIINPFLSIDTFDEVDPVECYGEAFLNSDFCK